MQSLKQYVLLGAHKAFLFIKALELFGQCAKFHLEKIPLDNVLKP